jgi:polyhydroxybutyrate depolymerase
MRGRFKGITRFGLLWLSAFLTWQGVLTPVNAQEWIKQVGDHDVVIMVDKLKRHFILHVPTSYEDSKPLPLVVMLHGHGGTAKAISRVGWSEEADKNLFLVAYPDAERLKPDQPPGPDNVPTWNDGSGREGVNTSVDDMHFLKALLAFVSKNLSVDQQRIYMAGFSQGAATTFNLGVALSDQLAAIGVASAQFAPKDDPTLKLAHPMPLIYMIGTADKLNPLNGGEAPNALTGGTRTTRPIQESIDGWLKLNQCSATPTNILNKMGVVGKAYICPPNFELDYYTIDGMGHTWPLGPRPRTGGNSNVPVNKISGVQTMWAFFSKFTLAVKTPQN